MGINNQFIYVLMENNQSVIVAIKETTPLSNKDCFYLADRNKAQFTYPLHTHCEYEINFVSGAPGVKRIVGDSIEIIGEYDLVLITNENLEHVWEQHTCTSKNIREITIQFLPHFFLSSLQDMRQFESINQMFEKAKSGISFPLPAIMKIFPLLDKLANEKNSFYALINFLTILYELSLFNNQVKMLAGTPTACKKEYPEDKIIQDIKKCIKENYKQELRLDQLADMANMSPTAFSRFFKQRTGYPLSDYTIDVRLNHASRLLTDTIMPVSEICNECGFNNLSNFNRLFKKKKTCSPKELRENCQKKKLIF